MPHTPRPNWTPRSPIEALTIADTILAPLVTTISAAQQALHDLIPVGGRPAGNGSPPSGSRSITSPTERTALTVLPPEARDLADLTDLTNRITRTATSILNTVTIQPQHPPVSSLARQLTWARWAIRQTNRALTAIRATNPDVRLPIAHHDTKPLVRDCHALADLIGRSIRTPTRSGDRRTINLAADDTELWCRSCLRAGHRSPRSDRYPKDGVCRWCGQFNAEQHQYPTLALLDAHHAGQRITVQMVNDALRPPKRKRKKK